MQMPKLRFMADDGNDFPEWEENSLSLFLKENKLRNVDLRFGKDDVLSVSGDYGVVNQIEFQGRSFAGKSVQQYRILPHNGIVYTKSPLKANPYGIIKANKGEDGIVSTLYTVFDCKDNIIPEFIELYFDLDERLNKYLKPLVNIGAKHDMKISNERFLSGRVCFPSIPEQRKIATFLSTIDEIIATTAAEVSAWEERKKGVMQKLFSQEVRFKADDGSDFPEWEEKKLGEIANFIGGGTPSTKIKEYWNGYMPWISSSDLFEDDIRTIRMTRFITDQAIKDSSTKRIPKNSILVICRVGVGKVAVSSCELCTSQDFVSLVDFMEDKVFLAYALLRLMKNKIKNVQGTSIKGIPVDEIKSYSIELPSLPEQQKIADCLSSFDDVIKQTKAELAAWQEFKKGLLQQMFV